MYKRESVITGESFKKGSREQKGIWNCIWDSKTREKNLNHQTVSSGGCPHFGDTWKAPFRYPLTQWARLSKVSYENGNKGMNLELFQLQW